ncbi:MAG: CotH kinase family protein [Muribaculaceae bacterium]|nr:CotH kinase family protein [Muribaculaceae bacterium]
MKKILCHICIMLVALICFSANCYALEFKAGIYYFDNSKLKFNNVKMVLGNEHTTYVYDMISLGDDSRLKGRLNQDLSDLTGFCFIESDTMPGTYNKGLQFFLKGAASDNPNFRQTKVLESLNTWAEVTGWVFYPLNDAPKSDGYWRPLSSYGVEPSRTVPLVHINTQDSMPIISKDYYINGELWIDNCGIEGFESLGSDDAPMVMEIKGRGNYTWTCLKKPYKIKFAKKLSPLGLDNSKHFVLKPDCDDWSGYLRNETGFETSRQLGMPYTTRQYPVELILNGEYEGIYFLCEKIRVESGRVDIMEQIDNDTNPYNVTGGWLIEKDGNGPLINAQYQNNDPDESFYYFSSESPELLSQEQLNYITPLLQRIDSLIFVADKNDTAWENYLDINSLAKYYVIQEVMESVESFSGSLFMYKDWGEDEKFKFGPVWDFDCSTYANGTTGDHFIFEYETEFTFLWIKELLKFPHFQQNIRMVWKEFMANDLLSKVLAHAHQWRNIVKDAEIRDSQRWPFLASVHPEEFTTQYLDIISRKVAWLDEQWTVPVGDVDCDGHVTSVDVTIIYNYLLNGDETHKYTCDVNGDGHINSVDITTIYDILLNQN